MSDILSEVRELLKRMKHETDYLYREKIADEIELLLRKIENNPAQLLDEDSQGYLQSAWEKVNR